MPQTAPLIRADLGPTNTGKTHFAIERMLQYRSGVIGLPLRLLAREVYDRIAARIGKDKIALITGEERIIGAKTRYWVATVEAMPQDIHTEIAIIDEIQLAADLERGHIFTDRLLHMRGSHETLFLGSHAMRPVLRKLIPNIEFETRERLSSLRWVGRKKLSQLPPRSAIIAFSAEEVYATAEFLRRAHGGAAVVMGALSPRTRNAQVALYQSGALDYIVATDAIGMGLNLDIDQIFFASTEKFDGQRHRALFPHELAQIAGRAGRFSRDGGFGITAQAAAFSPETIEAIETHHFSPPKKLQWRNTDLNFATLDALLASLEQPSPNDILTRTREADDLRALRHLSKQDDIRALSQHPKHVEMLWSTCQLPDFPKFAIGEHLALVEHIYRALRSDEGVINEDFAESEIKKLAKSHHNIDILGRKLAQIRTWRYIAQRNHWLQNTSYWRNRTADIEDALSDALHQALLARFVDERTSQLKRRLKEKESIMAEVNAQGQVTIDGNYVGELRGFQFQLDGDAVGEEAKTIAKAASEALKPVFHLRSENFYNAADKDITFNETGTIFWEDTPIGAFEKGKAALEPSINIFVDENMPQEQRDKIARRLQHWYDRKRDDVFAPLLAIQNDTELAGLVKGVGFRLVENMGVIPRAKIAKDIKELSQDERAQLRKHGVRFGQYTVFIPLLLKPAPTELRILLSALWFDQEPKTPPPAGLVTISKMDDYDADGFALAGYHLAGARAIRVDMLERLADLLRDQNREGFEASPDMLSITGLSLDDLAELLGALGYDAQKGERQREKPTKAEIDTAQAAGIEPVAGQEIYYVFKYQPRHQKPKHAPKNTKASQASGSHDKKGKSSHKSRTPRKEKSVDPDSPFAALAALKGQV